MTAAFWGIALFVAAVVAYRSSWWGLLLLVAASCTLDVVTTWTSFQLAQGSIALGDGVMVGLLVNMANRIERRELDGTFWLCLLMAAWLVFAVTVAGVCGQVGLREVYRGVFRIATLWMLPITVRRLTPVMQMKLMTACLVAAMCMSAFLDIVLLAGNSDLWRWMVLLSAAGVSQNVPAQLGELPRLYIAGHIFLKLAFAYAFCLLIFGSRVFRRDLLLGVVLSAGLFIVLLRGKSDVIFILVVVCAAAWLSQARKLADVSRRSEALVVTMALALCVVGSVALAGQFQESLPGLIARQWRGGPDWRATVTVRLGDTQEAWQALLGSPLWGIGVSKVHWTASRKAYGYGGQDVHPFVSQGLIGGFPAIALLFAFLAALHCAVVRHLGAVRPSQERWLAAAPGLAAAVLLSVLNTTPVFLYPSAQVPFGIFSGLLLSRAPHETMGPSARGKAKRMAFTPLQVTEAKT